MTPAHSGVFDGDGQTLQRMTPERTQMIESQALLAGVPADLALAVVWVESRFNPRALSGVGAQGLMQLMPATYNELAKRLGLGSDAFNERDNVRAGVGYLAALIKRWAQQGICYAVASYFAGSGNVQKHGIQVRAYQDYVRAVMWQRDRFAVALLRTVPGPAISQQPPPGWIDGTCHTVPHGKSSSGSKPAPRPSPQPAPRPSPLPVVAGAGGLLLLVAAVAVAEEMRFRGRSRRRYT